jgi:Brp/Blh family beta-carotene 15,15'-monooxygenase
VVFEYSLALFLIGIIGISHGSIDHILATEVLKILPKKKLTYFIAVYLAIIALYVAFWFISPQASFVLFLLYSAYHFGQADTEIVTQNTSQKLSKYIGFNYGLIIISALMISNTGYITSIFPAWFNERINLASIIQYSGFIFYASIGLQVLFGAYLYFKKLVGTIEILQFGIQLFIVLFIFKSLPPLIAFSLYFGLWHSLLILQKEYMAFTSLNLVANVTGFIQKLAPFTLVSLVGLMAIVYISNEDAVFTTLIAISALAFPHTILMDRMYSQKTPKIPE